MATISTQLLMGLATASSPGAMSAEQHNDLETVRAANAGPYVGPVNLIIDADWGLDGDDISAWSCWRRARRHSRGVFRRKFAVQISALPRSDVLEQCRRNSRRFDSG